MNGYTKKMWMQTLYIILGVCFVIFLWWILSFSLHTTLIPNPWETFKHLFQMLGTSELWKAIGGTLLRLLISFVISFLLALILGIVAGLCKPIYQFLRPLVLILRTLPTAAVIFILIVLTKPLFALFIITFLLIFPILYEAVSSGIQNIDVNIMNSLKLDGGVYNPKSLFKIILPISSPYIFLGIVQALGLGMKVSIMAEVLCGDNFIPGLGRLIYYANQTSDMKTIFAVSIVAILLIGSVDIILSIAKKKIKK